MKDYYKILGVAPKASQAEIKTAYRLLAVKHHPDKNNGDKASEERFKEISESYIILGDIAKRNAYDYTKGYQKNYYGQDPNSDKATPATYLILFKSIKTKVFNAGGRINQEALFKVIDDILTDENINFLIRAQHVNTNSMILDEIVTSCIFLNDSLKTHMHARLLKLADGDPQFINKISILKNPSTVKPKTQSVESVEEQSISPSLLVFIVVIVIIIAVLAI
ncbi:hypothetical protein FMM05_10470 [Flavobacterium zepuense]|uniref:J domain-containing protein n=1 Tax=Flavobacterium zepuense TaxID=2593302 RepID=A0A552V1B4_9FLAO|nr:J domain-containing protein [Flavobacterium zepuense]TRW24250.1 hypothetical protein FMM05_10470 [Flavobacterium zepuense]